MAMYPHVPFPVNFTLSSPLVHLAPIASNSTTGWTPSCTSSVCVTTASWSTNTTDSILSIIFYGLDAAVEGTIQGDAKVQATVDGQPVDWNPSGDALLSVHGLDQFAQHNLTMKLVNVTAGSRLTVNQARVNGSTITDKINPFDEWTLFSNDKSLSYSGFVEESSTPNLASPTTYVSSKAGDKMSLSFNGSAAVVWGPCGPSNGLIRVTLDNVESTLNTSTPLQADDCLLFQTAGLPTLYMHNMVIENVDGRSLSINRLGFIRVIIYESHSSAIKNTGKIVGIVLGVIIFIAALIVAYSMRSRKTRQKINKTFTFLCS